MTSNLPMLYIKKSNGTIHQWEIKVESFKDHSIIITEYGIVGKKLIVSKKTIKSGKNIGKANETTHYQQAYSQAQSAFEKKKDSGYTPNKSGESSSSIKLPMLALNYNVRYKDIQFPCYIQPKLNGVRNLLMGENFYSRKGKKFYFLEPLLKNLFKSQPPKNITWDGELYSDELTFQEIVSTIKQKNQEPNPSFLKKMKYVVFDCWDSNNLKLSYKERYNLMKKYIKKEYLIENLIANSDKEIKTYHKQFTKAGYEGIIVRNIDGIYKFNARSKDLQKYKEFLDAEYKCINFKEGEGKEKDQIIFQLKAKGGDFWCRPKGTEKERKEAFKKGKDYIGKLITVTYQELSDSGIPIFPVCSLVPRNYE